MTTWTWIGSSGADFSTASNWDPAGVPGDASGDVVIIPDGSVISLSQNVEIPTLELSGTVTFTSTASYTLYARTAVQLAAGTDVILGSNTLGSNTLEFDAQTLSGTGTYTFENGTITNNSGISINTDQIVVLKNASFTTDNSISGDGNGTIVLDGGTIEASNGGIQSVNIEFGTSDAENTVISTWTQSIASISNFGYNDRIQIAGSTNDLFLTSNGDGTYSLKGNNGYTVFVSKVTLESGTILADYQMVDGYFEYTGAAPCFMAGTLLATPEGQIAVEDVTEGTLLRTADGRALAVRWVGRSTVSRRFGNPMEVLPIRIRAGALGEALPARDLLVSPGHALFLDGVLVQAGALVNGVSIVREHDVPELFTYYHVELATHELLLAEGTPAESFVDNVERTHFQNWAERQDTEDEPAMVELPYPRAQSSRQVPQAVRVRLEARARLFGVAAAA